VRILSRLVDDALHHRQGTFGRAAKFFRLQSRSEVVWYLECPQKTWKIGTSPKLTQFDQTMKVLSDCLNFCCVLFCLHAAFTVFAGLLKAHPGPLGYAERFFGEIPADSGGKSVPPIGKRTHPLRKSTEEKHCQIGIWVTFYVYLSSTEGKGMGYEMTLTAGPILVPTKIILNSPGTGEPESRYWSQPVFLPPAFDKGTHQ